MEIIEVSGLICAVGATGGAGSCERSSLWSLDRSIPYAPKCTAGHRAQRGRNNERYEQTTRSFKMIHFAFTSFVVETHQSRPADADHMTILEYFVLIAAILVIFGSWASYGAGAKFKDAHVARASVNATDLFHAPKYVP
jgi:hypothetical protein